jgi:hypothetical protein
MWDLTVSNYPSWRGGIFFPVILALALSFSLGPAWAGADEAYAHLQEVMDKYNDVFYVYLGRDEGGNHFFPSGKMGDLDDLAINTNWTSGCLEADARNCSCTKVVYTPKPTSVWAGLYWQEPENNWGGIANAGYDLRGADRLVFRVKGEKAGGVVEFFAGGLTGEPLTKTSITVTLTEDWKKYEIPLDSKDLRRVIGGFGFSVSKANFPSGATFYLDNIYYNQARPDDLRLLVSYETFNLGGADRTFKNSAYVYDNSLALLAFLARGGSDDLRRARILADGLVAAQNHDRKFTDGRLRNGYKSGDLIYYYTDTAQLPGYWNDDTDPPQWYEDQYAKETYTGNLAWAMIALLHYYKKMGGAAYLNAAVRLGNFIEANLKDTRSAGGYNYGYRYVAGTDDVFNKDLVRSMEHNIDLYVAFRLLYEITSEAQWLNRAQYAKVFVLAMWRPDNQQFICGKKADGTDDERYALDAQAWAALALDSYLTAVRRAEINFFATGCGFQGFAFNSDPAFKTGVWFEGTAFMVSALNLSNLKAKADFSLGELRRVQISAPNANGLGIIAACPDLDTGFNWIYPTRLYVGATAWYIFAETKYNPFWGTIIKAKPTTIPPSLLLLE